MKIVLFLSAVLLGFIGYSQNYTYRVGGKISNSDTKKMEAGVTVTFLSNGKVIASTQTASNGKYDLKADAPFDGSIQVVYSKAGFVSKKVAVTTAKVNLEDVPGGSEFPLPTLDMDLFTERPNADFSFLNTEPVASFYWDDAMGGLNYDKAASAKTKKKIEDALAAVGNKSAEDEAKYQAAIKAAEGLYAQKKYEDAIAKYEEASLVKPKEPVPIAKIAELDKLIKDQKSQALAGQALETEYKNLISAADNLRDQKKYTEAITKYNEALKKKDDVYPKGEIGKLNKLIEDQKALAAKDAEFEKLKTDGMALAGGKKWTEAKSKLNQALAIKADAAITQKIKEIDAELLKESADKEKTEKYNAAMTMGDGLVKSGKYQEAKAKYTEAGGIDPSQTLPKTKIGEVNDLIAKQTADADKKAKIDKLITEGNTAYTKNDLATAKSKFEEVLTNDGTNTIAVAKLKEINGKLDAQKGQAEKDAQFDALKKEGMALATAKKYNEAKIKLQQAVDMKADAAISQKIIEIDNILKADQAQNAAEEDYKRIISEAASLESAKNYDGAIAKYKEAMAKKPTEALPKAKITELEKLKKDAAGQSQAEAQKTILYNTHMGNGAKNLAEKKYQQALTEFQNALSVKPNDSAAQGKISEIQQILDDLENTQNKNTETKKNFDKLILEADRLFKQEKYLEAKAVYEKALLIQGDDQRAIKQVAECDRLEIEKGKNEGSAEYKKLVSAADKKFNEKDYLKAKEYYERALGLKSTDPYPKAKLAEIERLLNPTVEVVKTNVVIAPEKLQALGLPYSDSEEQAQADLKAAELERENSKNKELKKGIQNVNDRSTELTDQKQEEHLATTADIFDVQTGIQERNTNNDSKHQEVIELEKKVIKEQADNNTKSENLENSDHLDIQDKMDVIRNENSTVYSESEGVYLDNGTEMKKHDSERSDALTAETKKYDDANQESVVKIRDIETTVLNKQLDDKESRLAVEERIEKVVDKTIQQSEEMNNKEDKENLDTKAQIVTANKVMGEKAELDMQNASEIGNDLEEIKHKVQESKDASIDKDVENGMEVTEQIVVLNKKLAEEVTTNDHNLQLSTELLKQANKDLQDNSVEDYNQEMVKYLANKNRLEEKTSTVNESTVTSTDKLIENNGLIKDKTTQLLDENAKQTNDQVEKHQNAQQSIHDKQTAVTAEKPIVANSLGAEYPEGVSQESFTQNDENGLMKAIITRRVVVVEGKGDVYVKTQTLNSITYSKNGNPTTERTWQKETQGPHLKKNY